MFEELEDKGRYNILLLVVCSVSKHQYNSLTSWTLQWTHNLFHQFSPLGNWFEIILVHRKKELQTTYSMTEWSNGRTFSLIASSPDCKCIIEAEESKVSKILDVGKWIARFSSCTDVDSYTCPEIQQDSNILRIK